MKTIEDFKLEHVRACARLSSFTGLNVNGGRARLGRNRAINAVYHKLVKEFPGIPVEEHKTILNEIRQRARAAL